VKKKNSISVTLAFATGLFLAGTIPLAAQGMVSAPNSSFANSDEQFSAMKGATAQQMATIQRILRRLGYLKAEELTRELDEPTSTALLAHFETVKQSPRGLSTEQVVRSLFAEAWIKEGWSTGSVEGQSLVVDKAEVQAAQEVLKKLNYEPGPVDGVFGPATLSSVESFQEDNGLRVRGLLTRNMQQNIMRALKFADTKPVSTIHMLNWNGYINPDSLDKFEKETNIRVIHDVFDLSSETKDLLLNHTDKYDVIIQTGAQMRLVLEGTDVVDVLDHAKIPNSQNVDPAILKVSNALDPDNTHTMPYMWGTVGLAVNNDMVKAIRPNLKVDSTSLILDPKIAADLSKCGIAVVDEPIDVIPSFITYLGGDIENISTTDLEAVDLAFSKVAKYIKRVSVESWIKSIGTGKYCVVWGYPGGTFRARDMAKKNGTGKITYNVPKEGTQMWMDFMVIPTHAQNKDAAYKLIDFMLRPDVAAANTNFLRFANAVTTSAPFIDPVLLNDPGLYPPAATLRKIAAMAPISKPVESLLYSIWKKLPKE
jgi:putrescine transport system substrate-binding protein